MSTVSDLAKKKFLAELFHAVANVMCLSSKIRLIENVLNSVHVLFLKFFLWIVMIVTVQIVFVCF